MVNRKSKVNHQTVDIQMANCCATQNSSPKISVKIVAQKQALECGPSSHISTRDMHNNLRYEGGNARVLQTVSHLCNHLHVNLSVV